jgi:PAS domain-containing protein
MPTWVTDQETLGFLEVNDAAVRLYGFSREEFLRMTAANLLPRAGPEGSGEAGAPFVDVVSQIELYWGVLNRASE